MVAEFFNGQGEMEGAAGAAGEDDAAEDEGLLLGEGALGIPAAIASGGDQGVIATGLIGGEVAVQAGAILAIAGGLHGGHGSAAAG